ncbi:hypothetical protein IEQ34_000088 [Dendrobium chrysotoxum]|uniref:Uncharacterized protein n=1 Tax=Dendrobium chrysotoxum TaxID=161865 RepID=A0AAV7HQD9_DENCH|nr:hypothetical protein IEQ34_000088 [Dendrobium chrysotoxum]
MDTMFLILKRNHPLSLFGSLFRIYYCIFLILMSFMLWDIFLVGHIKWINPLPLDRGLLCFFEGIANCIEERTKFSYSMKKLRIHWILKAKH